MPGPDLPPLPVRSPAEIAGAVQALLAPGGCCGHAAATHAPDGACRLERSTRCGCTGWRPADLTGAPVDGVIVDDPLEAEVGSSGDPLLDVVHDVLARSWPTVDGRWVAVRDELVAAVRAWAAGALGIAP